MVVVVLVVVVVGWTANKSWNFEAKAEKTVNTQVPWVPLSLVCLHPVAAYVKPNHFRSPLASVQSDHGHIAIRLLFAGDQALNVRPERAFFFFQKRSEKVAHTTPCFSLSTPGSTGWGLCRLACRFLR